MSRQQSTEDKFDAVAARLAQMPTTEDVGKMIAVCVCVFAAAVWLFVAAITWL